MPSIAESSGALLTSLFVPSNVISSQAENQRMLEDRAQKLNADAPGVLARATRNGTMSDGAARRSLQDMNTSLFLVNDSDRQLGEEAAQIVKESAANAPAVLADTVKGGLNTVGGTIWRAIPWWIWLAVGVYVLMQLAVFVKMLRTSNA